MRRLPRLALVTITLAAPLFACADTAPPRRQVVVVIDTDAVTPEDIAADPELSGAAAVDTVRVDVLDTTDRVQVFREFAAPGRLDWPISFGIVPPEEGTSPKIVLRIRAFRARDSEPTTESGVRTLSATPELAIDRVVEIPTPAVAEVERVAVHLSADCFGQPPSFGARTTCLDASTLGVPFSTPVPVAIQGTASRIGTTALARSVPCDQPPPPNAICVPGGLSIIGSADLAGLDDDGSLQPTLPMRLVRVSPFAMDQLEVTVGRARPFLGRLRGEQPHRKGSTSVLQGDYCTLEDTPNARGDSLPLNCITRATASELCALMGGDLPTEAEWNHAATGRGQGRQYPWGETSQGCCNASAARATALTEHLALCPGSGVEPVGSHRDAASCGAADISRDGIVDLGGSVSEALKDPIRRLDDPCWGPRYGILVDPRCPPAENDTDTATRGGSWSSGTFLTHATLRNGTAAGIGRGFRCVYRSRAR